MSPIRQHLIDPDICIRCETCSEMCEQDAISYDGVNVVVDFTLCAHAMDCIAPCPTGAIDEWRTVDTPYSLEEQYAWEDLPEEHFPDAVVSAGPMDADDEAQVLLDTAHAATGGEVKAPASAAKPVLKLYTRKEPAKAVVQGNVRITDSHLESDVHHIILDLAGQAMPVLEGQSLGVLPPGADANGRAHALRLYSVASPRNGERPNYNNIALTVKRVVEKNPNGEHRGVASNYLCDLKRGDTVDLVGPFGSSFLMPDDPDANIIMICTGTGSAPFRAMTERRRRSGLRGRGKLLLFFGARTAKELPYFGPLMKLPESLIHRELVFSRLPGQPKEYVQDRIRKCGPEVGNLLADEMTHVYVCGLKGMEEGVEDALRRAAEHRGLPWLDLKEHMLREGRYHVETY